MDDSTAIVPARFVDRDERHVRLEDFKRLLRDRHTVGTFVSADDLAKRLDKDLRQLLTRLAPETTRPDDFAESADTIRKFLLVPGQYSGQQVRVVVKVLGQPFPASRDICQAFQLSFGRTVGVRVLLQSPGGFERSGLDELYARGEHVAQLLVPANSSLDIYADLQFADKRIDRVEARFRSESGAYATISTVAPTPAQLGLQPFYHEADSKVAMLFSHVAGKSADGGRRQESTG